jgi:hypothetical protein
MLCFLKGDGISLRQIIHQRALMAPFGMPKITDVASSWAMVAAP